MKRTVLTAIALALSPSLATAEISAKALLGFWICEEASGGMGTTSQLNFQKTGHFDMDFAMQRADLKYPNSPDVSISGRWSLNGNILTVQSESSSILPSLTGKTMSGEKPLGEDMLVQVPSDPVSNLVHELADESLVFVREGLDLKTRCFRKPE